MLKKLRRKFVLIMMTIITAMLLVIFSLIFYTVQSDYIEVSAVLMRDAAMQSLAPDAPNERRDSPLFPCFVVQWQHDGSVLTSGEEFFDLSDKDMVRALFRSIGDSDEPEGYLPEFGIRYLRIRPMDSRLRVVLLDATTEINAMNNLLETCFLLAIICFAVFLGLSMFLAQVAVKPVERAWEEQRQFVADASHDLKTPLTVIMTNAELLRAPGYSAEERAGFGDNILVMSKKMRHLVEAMLELARADSGAVHQVQSRVDFSELAEGAVMVFEPLCYENGLILDSRIEKQLYLHGSDQHLSRLIEILLDNALKYSNPQGKVFVELKKSGTNCLFTVSNEGPEIVPEDLKKIFMRFYRVDKSRNQTESYGLGLAIAERIVSTHRGKIWAESADGVNRFVVRLPI